MLRLRRSEDAAVDVGAVPGGPEGAAPEGVAGERGIGSINRTRSLQSRVTNVLAMTLIGGLGVTFLGWYYVRTFSAAGESRKAAEGSTQTKAQAEMVLPPLGPVDAVPRPAGHPEWLDEEALGEEPPEGIPEAWTRPAVDGPPQEIKSPADLELARKLGGAAFLSYAESVRGAPGSMTQGPPPGLVGAGVAPNNSGALEGLLRPTATPAVAARVLPTQRLLLPKGAFIDCTLETAIDSTLPGMTTCVTATDTFGADGSTVLIERGSKLVGETQGEVRQGMARLFVLWSEARTPTGVVIALASPGTDALGRSGLAGKVNRHFFERFGAAMLISVIDGAVQSAAQSSDGSTVIYNPTTSSDVVTEVLRSTVNIPPTVTVKHGSRVQVLVARDLDFRSVYRLTEQPAQAARR
jgi:type IV secretion system protein VirB10